MSTEPKVSEALHSHKWVGAQQGGHPAEASSCEWIRYCEVCGMEDTCEDPLPPCPGSLEQANARLTAQVAKLQQDNQELREQKKAIGSAIYELHSMMVDHPLEADDSRTFSNALSELRVAAEKSMCMREGYIYTLGLVEHQCAELQKRLEEAGQDTNIVNWLEQQSIHVSSAEKILFFRHRDAVGTLRQYIVETREAIDAARTEGGK